MGLGLLQFQSSLALAPLMASAQNQGMDSYAQQMLQSIEAGDLETAVGEAHSTIDSFSRSPVSASTIQELQQLLAHEETRWEGLTSTLAIQQALDARQSPDAYYPNPASEQLDIKLNAPERQGQSALLTRSETSWGERLFNQTKRFWRGPFRRVQDRIFNEMMRSDETFKRQLIAFMDVASSVQNDATIAELIRLYFPRSQQKPRGLLGFLLKAGTSNWMPQTLLVWGFRSAVRGMASRFLAGDTIDQALRTVQRMQRKGYYASLDVVKERVLSQKEADAYTERVCKLMDWWALQVGVPARTAGGIPVRHVSVKLSALTHRFDPLAEEQVRREAGARLLKIFQQAKKHTDNGHPVMINIDLEEYHVRDMSYRLFWEVLNHPSLEGWEDAGIVIQAYLKDSESVLLQNIDAAQRSGKRPQVRVVKGAYHKYEQIHAARHGWKVPVFLDQKATNYNFQRLVHLSLLNADAIRLATGSHNIRDVGFSQEARESLNLAQDILEAQVLLGVGDPIAAATRVFKIVSRYYGPFGTLGEAIGYMVRRLAEVGPDSAIGKTHVAGDFKEYHVGEHHSDHKDGRAPLGTTQFQQPQFRLSPEADFADGEVRRSMQAALDDFFSEEAKRVVIPLVGPGESSLQDVSAAQPILNPADLNHPIGSVRFADAHDVERALAYAQEGYEQWSQEYSQQSRSSILERAADLVMERQYEIAATIVAEAGKPWSSALAETREAADFLRSYAQDGLRECISYDARGVGVAIGPFNFPFAIMMGELAEGLALGNAMIAKPAEQTPLSGLLAVEILRDAGVPKQALQFLPGGALVGAQLVESPDIDFIIFTGSQRTAEKIMSSAAQHPSARRGVKLVVAETGGKNALIVDETADLDVAVSAVLEGAFQFNGQRCSATSRVIVVDAVRDRFLERLVEGAKSMLVGNPRDPAVQLGPQIDERALDKAHEYIALGRREAELLYRYNITELAEHGFYLGPHIFVNVPPDARIAQEEIFAPVLAVINAASYAEARDIVNQSPYGLTAALISRHPGHIQDFMARVEAGNKYVNRAQIGARPWETPFGGGKKSGTGPKAGGRHIVARFGYPKIHRDTYAIFRDGPTAINREPFSQEEWVERKYQNLSKLTELAPQAEAMRIAQAQWARSSRQQRMALLRSIRDELARLESSSLVENRQQRRSIPQSEWKRALDRVTELSLHADLYLLPHSTMDLPGERNEVVFDQPLGLGYVWTENERFSNALAATVAAITMGNVVGLQTSTFGSVIAQLLNRAGVPHDLVDLVPVFASKKLFNESPFRFDFVAVHGPDGLRVNQLLFPENPVEGFETRGFRRLIGAFEDPTELRYLTYFAHASTRTERTLRHGADLDIRHVLNP